MILNTLVTFRWRGFFISGESMNRVAVLIGLLGVMASGACLAEDPAFCKSMCASEQRECRADAQLTPKEERFMPSDTPDRNPFARTAQGQVRSSDTRALDAAGDRHRRAARTDACATAYQRCTRSCDKPVLQR